MLRIQILSIALFAVATAQGMQTEVIGDIQIRAGSKMYFIGDRENNTIKQMGIPQSSFGNAMPAIKVDCFVQQGGKEHNWTEGELKPAFPEDAPVSMLWGLEADSKISFETKINGKKTAIKLYLRENFETGTSPEDQMQDALDSFVKNAHVKSDDPTHQFLLEQELIKKGLIRQIIQKDVSGQYIMQNIHTTGLGHKSIFEDILNQPGKDKAIQKALSKDLLNNEERQEVLSIPFKQSQNIVHLLVNRKIDGLSDEERQEVLSVPIKQTSQNRVHLLGYREIGRK